MKFSHHSEDAGTDINLTPLIDVVFLLLIFFMVTTTFSREADIKLNLPEADSATRQELDQGAVTIQINAIGQYAVQGPEGAPPRELLNTRVETLRNVLKGVAGPIKNPVIRIRADRLTPHEAVVKAMDAARQLGWHQITLATGLPQ